MPWPKGKPIPQEHANRIAETKRAQWARIHELLAADDEADEESEKEPA
jgi:hypothetical protein